MYRTKLTLVVIVFFCLIQGGICQEKSTYDSLKKAFFGAQVLTDKQKYYDDFIVRFPQSKASAKDDTYDDFKQVLAINYLLAGDTVKFKSYASGIKNKVRVAEDYNNTAIHLIDFKEPLSALEKLSALTLQMNADLFKNFDKYKPADYDRKEWNLYLIDQRYQFRDTYAYILFKQGNSKKALVLAEEVYHAKGKTDGKVAEHYSLYLSAAGKAKEARQIIEETLMMGYTSAVLLNELKETYSSINGSLEDYDDYYKKLESKIKESTRIHLAANMVKKPAPDFTLKDTAGHAVSLTDYKGKIVIIDFWATWCGPCKAAFAGMSMAVDKYKNNPNVKFLFLDTWENSADYVKQATKYINDSKYPFHVIFDGESSKGRPQVVAGKYGVKGIPTKFIIDQQGNIRFEDIGYAGVPEDLLMKLSGMIDILLAENSK